MGSVNKWIGIGNLGRDPEVRQVNGKSVANFSIACNEKWTDKQGDKQEKTEWVNLVLWDKLADLAGQYLKKGSQCYFEGKLQTRKYEKDGVEKYITEVVVFQMTFVGGGKKDDAKPAPVKPKPAQSNEPPPMDDDQVPF